MELITSPQNPRFRSALRLHSSRGRQKQNRILVVGAREVTRAVAAGISFQEIYLDTQAVDEESAMELCRLLGKSVRFCVLEQPLFAKLSYGDRDANIIGIAERPNTELVNLKLADESTVVVLEALEKPGNLGAIARSADGAGISALLLADPQTDIFHPNSIRASMATVFAVPIACGSTGQIKDWLVKNGFRIFVVTPEALTSVFDVKLSGSIAFVLGSESRGLNEDWRSHDWERIKLPMEGIADSLNVSVTAALIMYESRRQRSQRK